MNSPTGKRILSRVRHGDYAHPGEEEAIELVIAHLDPDGDRSILDVGCGRGGTAAYLKDRLGGEVSGLDSDAESIDYARTRYPRVEFRTCDVMDAPRVFGAEFDIMTLLTAFYAFADQPGALRALRRTAKPGAELILFDYWAPAGNGESLPVREDANAVWHPVDPEGIGAMCAATGWSVTEQDDLTDRFHDWYAGLVSRIDAGQEEIEQLAGAEWFEFVRAFYSGMLEAIEEKHLGGGITRIRAAAGARP